MKKILVCSQTKESLKEKILKEPNKKQVFSFFNSHDVYQFKNNKLFRESLEKLKKASTNLPDGFIVSFTTNSKRIRGPEFTSFFMQDKELNKNKKHFFIGFEEKDLNYISKKYSYLKKDNLFSYNPPYIKEFKFPEEEIKKIIEKINSSKVDYLWIGIGCPKQNILSAEIFDEISAKKIFNIGAALDFITDKKKEAPKIWRSIGLEWLYRLVTDFSYSKKKVWRSFIGSFYSIFIVKKIKRAK